MTKNSVDEALHSASGLAIIAGAGQLPISLAHACCQRERDVLIIRVSSFAKAEDYQGFKQESVGLGKLGKIIKILRRHHIAQVCFAGSLRRPSMWELIPDYTTLKFILRGALRQGDASLLQIIENFFVTQGFAIIAAQDIMPELLAPRGYLTKTQACQTHREDIVKGIALAKILGEADIGQAIAMQQGIVIGVEAIEGTSAMMRRIGDVKRKGSAPILIKAKKPQQSEKSDLPTIGPDTVRAAHQAGFAGIVVEAGGSLVLQGQETCQLAEEAGIFILGWYEGATL